MDKAKNIIMLLKQHKRSSIIVASCLTVALISGVIITVSKGSSFDGKTEDIADKESINKDEVKNNTFDKNKTIETDENNKKNADPIENNDKSSENEVVTKKEVQKGITPTYDNPKKEESKPTTHSPAPTPVPSKPEQPEQVEEPKPEQPPLACPAGENPNLPCDYIDLPAGYQVMDYETAKVKMAEADVNGGGYDYGWLTNNGGTNVFIIRFW